MLTLTLIAIIWYAYFTFRVARPSARVEAEAIPVASAGHFFVRFSLKNPMPYPLRARIFLRVFVDGDRAKMGPLYSGEHMTETLDPEGGGYQRDISLDEHVQVNRDSFGGESITNEEAIIVLQVEWIDNLWEKGVTPEKVWHFDFGTRRHDFVIDPQRKKELLAELP